MKYIGSSSFDACRTVKIDRIIHLAQRMKAEIKG